MNIAETAELKAQIAALEARVKALEMSQLERKSPESRPPASFRLSQCSKDDTDA